MLEWNQYYKKEPGGELSLTQMAYEPLISSDGKIFCMNFDPNNKYQDFLNTVGNIPDLVYTFFDKEIYYLEKFKNYVWCPEVLDVDYKNKKIFLKWYNNTCNDTINQLNEIHSDWESQLETIIRALINNRVYKVTLYPHCFYVDNNNTLKTFDYYGCFNFNNATLTVEKLNGLIHRTSQDRFNECINNNVLDIKKLFERSLETHIQWPNNFLNKIYKRLKDDKLV